MRGSRRAGSTRCPAGGAVVLLQLCLLLGWVPAATTAQDPPFPPRLPNSFASHVEVKDRVGRKTSIFREYVDFGGNRIRFDSQTNGTHISELVDANLGFYFVYKKGSCQILPVSESRSTVDPVGHIRSTEDRFRLDIPGANYSYLGVSDVRGMPADRWRLVDASKTFIASSGMTYILNYTAVYDFLQSDWSSPDKPQNFSTPLRYEENGTWTVIDTAGSVVMTVPRSTSFDYIHFHPDTPSEWHFSRGYLGERYRAVCPTWSYSNIHKSIPLLPDSFSSRIEGNIVEKNYTLERRDVYDAVNNRVLQVTHLQDGSVKYLLTTFDDKSEEVVDTIYIAGTDGSCSKTIQTRKGIFRFNATDSHLFHTADIFGERGDFSYQGLSTARGVEADMWMKEDTFVSSRPGRPNITFLLSYYFSRSPPWVVRSNARGNAEESVLQSSPIPLRAKLDGFESTGKHFRHYYEFVDFVPVVLSADFQLPPECETGKLSCEGDDDGGGISTAGQVALAVILSILIAAPIGGCAGCYYERKLKKHNVPGSSSQVQGAAFRHKEMDDVQTGSVTGQPEGGSVAALPMPEDHKDDASSL